MLKYSIRLTENDFKDTRLVWREKYVAPDLSFISGVTDASYHLEQFSQLPAYNSYTNQSAILNINAKLVTRLGYVIAKEKEYPVKTVTFSGQTYDYIQVNGKYFYDKNGSGYTITNWQKELYKRRKKDDDKYEYYPVIEERTINAKSEESIFDSGVTVVKLDTIYWIEDGFVNIDGIQYIFDKNEVQSDGKQGCIKFTDKGGSIENVTNCSSMYYMPYTSITQIHDVCKFTATCEDDRSIMTNSIDYSEYFFYVKYKEHYCPIIVSGDTFMCEIPNYVLDPTVKDNYSASTLFDVYYDDIPLKISGDVYDISDIYGIDSYIYIDDNGKPIVADTAKDNLHKFHVESDYRRCNSSRDIMIDLARDVEQFEVGDMLTLEYASDGETYIDVEDDNGLCILFDGKRYNVKPNLFDKASISGETYDIEYDDTDSINAYVIIEGERVPMKINGDTLMRYGKVIGLSGEVVSQTADIEYYSGVTVDDNDYEVEDNTEYSATSKVIMEGGNKIKLRIIDIKGNSLLICEPYIDGKEFSSGYIYNKQYALASELVENQDKYGLLYRNGIFGEMPITEDLAFLYTDAPRSSDEYYNLFDDLVIGTKNGYINVPITFGTNMANNIFQSEVVKEDFCERERDKRINKIVDMEKDVYLPKYLPDGISRYSGSSTEFLPIYKINVNLHFRTRNMTNWKVNDGNSDISVSGTADNWFITDYEPYKYVIETLNKPTTHPTEKTRLNKLMMNTSDLLYLLYFTDDDVYYQKSRLAKSFLRISIYDSTDPQTQSLLATSTVFVNEHDLFKKYIDYSRRGINKFLMLDFGSDKDDCAKTNKIKTRTEIYKDKKDRYIGCKTDEKVECDVWFGDTNIEGDEVIRVPETVCVDFSEDTRLSSRLVVDNKYDTDTSSEGFYIYMFREYSQKLHPKRIYMKIEYNHAGIGKTIPFFVPMHFKEGEEDEDRFLTFMGDDLEELKRGIPLNQVYRQSYIPLYAVYDFKNKEYAYMFDEHYIEPIENGVLNLNLFEMKISNEEYTVTGETATRSFTRTAPTRTLRGISRANYDNGTNIDINNYFGL